LTSAVPVNSDLLTVVISNTCGQAYTYSIDHVARRLQFQGIGDLHEQKYNSWARSTSLEDFEQLIYVISNGLPSPSNIETSGCLVKFDVYPTQEMEDTYLTREPLIYAFVSGSIFLFTSLLFYVYDLMVRRRQAKIMASAKRTNDIVTSLFPEIVRHCLYEQVATSDSGADEMKRTFTPGVIPTVTLSSRGNVFGSEPIADLFPHATVMFINIAGFNAWSSEREASQVITLLENLYLEFDKVGRQLGIFKVETIGDSYVAVSGLPTPRKDHAVGESFLCCVKMMLCYLTFYFLPCPIVSSIMYISNDQICLSMLESYGGAYKKARNNFGTVNWRPQGTMWSP
jgi:hypothetical protein